MEYRPERSLQALRDQFEIHSTTTTTLLLPWLRTLVLNYDCLACALAGGGGASTDLFKQKIVDVERPDSVVLPFRSPHDYAVQRIAGASIRASSSRRLSPSLQFVSQSPATETRRSNDDSLAWYDEAQHLAAASPIPTNDNHDRSNDDVYLFQSLHLHNVPQSALPRLSRVVKRLMQPLVVLKLFHQGDSSNEDPTIHVDRLLARVAREHPRLQVLHVPEDSLVQQSTLNLFRFLTELSVIAAPYFERVDFFASTLRVLYASRCPSLTDSGLYRATHLEVLHVAHCRRVRCIDPFEHCIVELNISGSCGISTRSLANCNQLRVLDTSWNDGAWHLARSLGAQLRELHAQGCEFLPSDALAGATHLVHLTAFPELVTVKPFAASLRHLTLRDCALRQQDSISGLCDATNVVRLRLENSPGVSSLSPFAASLLELEASDEELTESWRLLRGGANLHC